MNERIRELYNQCFVLLEHDTPNTGVDFEKFAELIVRECAELSVNSQYVNAKSEYYEGFNEALVYAGNKIKQHFGVEE